MSIVQPQAAPAQTGTGVVQKAESDTQRPARSVEGDTPAIKTSTRSELTPQLVVSMREGYGARAFASDALAGLTVAILALPLSMAIAIGTGTTPDRGIITSVIAGFLISAFGGSRYQVGGPAAAFIVINAAVIAQHGLPGLMTATFLAGCILVVAALLRLGTFIKYVPGPVILGFTSGIGIIIAISQLKDLFGLQIGMPGDVIQKLQTLWIQRGTVSGAALLVGLTTLALISAFKAWRPAWPGLLFAVIISSAATAVIHLPVATIGSRFGGIPTGLPWPALPDLSWPVMIAVLPSAFTIAFLVGVESLLSAIAADAKTGGQHRSNTEVLGQGLANMASPLFGGLPATGVIARTATNISAGGKTPVSGMLHAVFVLVFMALLAPLAFHLALPCLAAVLLNVSWRLIDFREVAHFLWRAPFDDRLILLSTLLLTVLVDLNVAIAVGVGLGCILFMHRMAELSGNSVANGMPLPDSDDASNSRLSTQVTEFPPDVQVYHLRGPLFFGGASAIPTLLRALPATPRILVLHMRHVPLIDSTALSALDDVAALCRTQGCRIIITALQAQPRHVMHRMGFLRTHKVLLAPTEAAAKEKVAALLARRNPPTPRKIDPDGLRSHQ